MPNADAAPRSAVVGRLLFVAFLLTGAVSLLFEIIWTRLLLLVVGTTPTAISVVLGAFMGGMGIGSWIAGRWLNRWSPIKTYAWLEAWIGLYALATPWLLGLVAAAPPALQIPLATLLLLPATVAMGASLPVLSRALGEGAARPAVTVGFLYAANTVGGVLGPLVGVFALFPWLGLQGTLVFGALANFVVCAALLTVSSYWRQTERPDVDLADSAAARVGGIALVVLATSGATAMVYEVAWSRTLSMAYGSSIYGVSIMLSMFLLGLAGGAWLASLVLARRRGTPTSVALAWLLAGSASTAFVSLHLGRTLPLLFLDLFRLLPDGTAGIFAIQIVLALVLMLPTTLCLGAMLPTAVAVVGGRQQIGRAVSRLYAANLFGSASGAILASVSLVASVGIEASVRIAALAALFLAFVIIVRQPRLHVLTAGATALASVVILSLDGTAARVTQTFGLYAAAPAYAPYSDQSMRQVLAVHQLLYYRDGPSATVAVQAVDKYRLLKINGKTDASNGAGDAETQTLVGQLPLMATDAKRVAVIGWGSGMTVGAVLTHPVEAVGRLRDRAGGRRGVAVLRGRQWQPTADQRSAARGPARQPDHRRCQGRAATHARAVRRHHQPAVEPMADRSRESLHPGLLRAARGQAGGGWHRLPVVPHLRDVGGLGAHDRRDVPERLPTRRSRSRGSATSCCSARSRRSSSRCRISGDGSLGRRSTRVFGTRSSRIRPTCSSSSASTRRASWRSPGTRRSTPTTTCGSSWRRPGPSTSTGSRRSMRRWPSTPPIRRWLHAGTPSNAALHLELASSYFTAGVDAMAMQFCRRAIDMEPSFEGMKLLGQIAQRQGDTLMARNAYNLALALGGDPGGRAFVQGLLRSLDTVFVSND